MMLINLVGKAFDASVDLKKIVFGDKEYEAHKEAVNTYFDVMAPHMSQYGLEIQTFEVHGEDGISIILLKGNHKIEIGIFNKEFNEFCKPLHPLEEPKYALAEYMVDRDLKKDKFSTLMTPNLKRTIYSVQNNKIKFFNEKEELMRELETDFNAGLLARYGLAVSVVQESLEKFK